MRHQREQETREEDVHYPEQALRAAERAGGREAGDRRDGVRRQLAGQAEHCELRGEPARERSRPAPPTKWGRDSGSGPCLPRAGESRHAAGGTPGHHGGESALEDTGLDEAAEFTAQPGNDAIRAKRDEVREVLDSSTRLVDVRSPAEYSGEVIAMAGYEQEGAQRARMARCRLVRRMEELDGVLQ